MCFKKKLKYINSEQWAKCFKWRIRWTDCFTSLPFHISMNNHSLRFKIINNTAAWSYFDFTKEIIHFVFIFIWANSKWLSVASAKLIQDWSIFDKKKNVSQLWVDYYIYVAKFTQNWQLLFDLAKLEYGSWYQERGGSKKNCKEKRNFNEESICNCAQGKDGWIGTFYPKIITISWLFCVLPSHTCTHTWDQKKWR